MNALNAAQRMQMIEKFESLTIKEYGALVSENEQLRQRVAELEKERDEEIARNRPLRNLIASLEEQKSHWNKYRNENREAVSTLDSERSANATLTAERDALLEANRIACEDLVERHDRIAELAAERDKATQYWQIAEGRCDALKQQRDELLVTLEKFLDDNDPEGFGCACEPGRLCGPCSEAKRQRPLYAALASVKEKA